MTPSFAEMLRTFGRIGLLSFGGPAAQISLMHEELVSRRRWLREDQFLGALSFCMLLPGPEAMQLATYAGWRLRGVAGGLLAGLLFVLPGALVILALALGYARYGEVPLVQGLFLGVKAAVVVIVLQALQRLARKTLTRPDAWALAGLGFAAMFVLKLPFPLVIAAAALWGALRLGGGAAAPRGPARPFGAVATLRVALIWAAIWLLPLVIVAASGHGFLTGVGLFFAKLAVVTFGGAYAVLGYMAQTVVEIEAWISPAQMIDALGLAETTPGPLILVTEFVALLAGYLEGGTTMALAAGALALWVTFAPCFLWIFAGAPHLEALLARPRLKGALAGISAAVVGVILNLSVWFALNVVFADVAPARFGLAIDPGSLQPLALALIAIAAVLLLRLRLSMPLVLALMALCAGALGQLS